MAVRAVFFDMYNTVLHQEPQREQIQQQALRELGIEVPVERLRRAFLELDRQWYEQRRQRRRKASAEAGRASSREEAWLEYELGLLRAAGLEPARELAAAVLRRTRAVPTHYVLYEDVVPTVSQLRRRGLVVGLISNIDRPIEDFAPGLGLSSLFDFTVTSGEVGADKPDPRIFQAALRKAGVASQEALHVGDQYLGDVLGARAAGITPLLLDRYGLLTAYDDCVRVQGLGEVLQYL